MFTTSKTDDKITDEEGFLIRNPQEEIVSASAYRWLILVIYSLTAFANTLVWLSLFTVTDITAEYYKINSYVLLWSSNAFTFAQVLIAIPASFLPSKIGLRSTMILASAINAIGALIMSAGTYRDGFLFFIFGQTIVAVAASILPQLAPQLSATWFPTNEHAISTSIGVIIGNSGAAIGFLQPAILMPSKDIEKNIGHVDHQLKVLVYSQAGLCVLLFLLAMVFFKNEPRNPPSLSEAIRRDGRSNFSFTEFRSGFKTLLTSCNYQLCANSYALINVLLVAVPVFLSNIMVWKYKNNHTTVGWMGFTGILVGLLGSILFGIILDKTHAYKKLAAILGALSLAFWIVFTEILAHLGDITANFVAFVMCLFFFVPLSPVLVETMCEMTYPIPESMSYVLSITASRFYSIPVVFFLGWLTKENHIYIVCYMIALIIASSVLLVIILKVEKKRDTAEERCLDNSVTN